MYGTTTNRKRKKTFCSAALKKVALEYSTKEKTGNKTKNGMLSCTSEGRKNSRNKMFQKKLLKTKDLLL
jgi:hypothetical protein